jgi:hypothetical protein
VQCFPHFSGVHYHSGDKFRRTLFCSDLALKTFEHWYAASPRDFSSVPVPETLIRSPDSSYSARGRRSGYSIQEQRRRTTSKAVPRHGLGHIVFEPEKAGAAMGVKMLNMEGEAKYTPGMHKQAAIQTTGREKTISGQ